jgi:hypothetical protein
MIGLLDDISDAEMSIIMDRIFGTNTETVPELPKRHIFRIANDDENICLHCGQARRDELHQENLRYGRL